jgi:lactate dehydrogenase-like 2-hydroxyacid dehydrogenase
MKDGVVIVNTARGELLERSAFVEALTSGKVRCAGTDVLEQEPPGEDNPLRSLENFYILPHVGSYTEKSLRAMDEKMVEDVKDILKEEIPRELVNPKVLRKKNRAGISL